MVGKSFGSYVTHTVSRARESWSEMEAAGADLPFALLQSGNFIYMYINQLAFVRSLCFFS